MPEIGQTPTLRERRKQETRDEIRRIALALVLDRGYDAVTVDMISESAGISARTFFNYFPSKESAMIAVPPPLPKSAVEEFLSRDGYHHLFADLARLAVSMFDQDSSAPSDFESSIQIAMSVPALATLQYGVLVEPETKVTELIAARLGLDSDEEQPAVIAAAFTGAIRVACQRCSRNPGRRPFAEELRACLTVLSTAATASARIKKTPAARNR